jgi:hypothetical protein
MVLLRNLLFTACLCATSLAGPLPEIPQEHRVILKGDWTPSPEQTQKALEAVARQLQKPLPKDVHDPKSHELIASGKLDYYVQFIGRRENRRDTISCIFFLLEEVFPQRWREEETGVFDAGAGWWWMRYDPASDRIE